MVEPTILKPRPNARQRYAAEDRRAAGDCCESQKVRLRPDSRTEAPQCVWEETLQRRIEILKQMRARLQEKRDPI